MLVLFVVLVFLVLFCSSLWFFLFRVPIFSSLNFCLLWIIIKLVDLFCLCSALFGCCLFICLIFVFVFLMCYFFLFFSFFILLLIIQVILPGNLSCSMKISWNNFKTNVCRKLLGELKFKYSLNPPQKVG